MNKISISEKCNDCNGGTIYFNNQSDYDKWQATTTHPFFKKGTEDSPTIISIQGVSKARPFNIPCHCCEGTGLVSKDITIDEFKALIK